MPFCRIGEYSEQQTTEGVHLFYQLYGHGDAKVLLITGVAATYEAWGPQIKHLCGTDVPNEDGEGLRNVRGRGSGSGNVNAEQDNYERGSEDHAATRETGISGNGVQVCAFDNRGVGRSSAPTRKQDYTTEIMARDALTLMDHLGWQKAHVAGHSMGGMIACKLAAITPERIFSLALISTTGGGYECLPKIDKTMIRIAYRFLRAKTPEERAHVDLDTHYTKDYLDTLVGEEYRRALLYKEYVKNLSSSGLQPKHGLDGQFNACWTHSVTPEEIDKIRSADVIVAIIHGRGDIVAQIRHARKLARKLHPVARLVELPGGHLVTHQNTKEVNEALLDMIRAERLHRQWPASNDVYGQRWQLWQRAEAVDVSTTATDEQLACGCVAPVAEILNKMWPQWLSLLYVFPTIYWPLIWARSYLKVF